jgi:hypothetical protein
MKRFKNYVVAMSLALFFPFKECAKWLFWILHGRSKSKKRANGTLKKATVNESIAQVI